MALTNLIGSLEDTLDAIRELNPGSRVIVAECDSVTATQELPNYLKLLKEQGLDIGRGETPEFGYRMPVPPILAIPRSLIIFRRNYDRN